jgi:tRNA-specific 2-thiouridylase
LFGLTQEQLAHSLFPVGEMTKQEVREVARRKRLPVAAKAESQEICFVPSGNYVRFIEAYRAESGEVASQDTAGQLVSTSGEVLGRHSGVHHFTVGQRKGIGIAAPRPLYVLEIDPESRRVTVGEEHELRRDTCDVRDVNWIAWDAPPRALEAMVRIRYRHEPAEAVIEPGDNSVALVHFRTPQRAITPGQAAVFYSGDEVLGGGWIR